jgi:hypothetical protein
MNLVDEEEEDANHFVYPMNLVDEEDATTTGGDPGGSTDAAARARLHSFVDEAGNPICLKFAGYYWNNFHRVPPGKCRWGEECHLSHNLPSDDTKARLEELRRHHAKRKAAKEMATAKAEQAALNAPLPEWLHATRTTRVFECCRQGDEHDGKGGKSEDPWCRMQAALSVLLSLSVTDRPRKRTIVTEEQLEGLSLNQLHLCGELSTERVPLVPTLAHAFRLAGRKFPKSWTMAYKQTRSMIRLMTRQTAYENFIQAYEEFVREVIAPLAGVEEGNGLRYQCPPTLRVHMPGRAPVRAGRKGCWLFVSLACCADVLTCLVCFVFFFGVLSISFRRLVCTVTPTTTTMNWGKLIFGCRSPTCTARIPFFVSRLLTREISPRSCWMLAKGYVSMGTSADILPSQTKQRIPAYPWIFG